MWSVLTAQETGDPEAEQIFPAGHASHVVAPGLENYNTKLLGSDN